MKIIFLAISFILSLFNYTKPSLIKMTSESTICPCITYNYESYHVKEYQTFIELFYNDLKVLVNEKPYSYKFIKDNKYLYYFYKLTYEDIIHVKLFNDKGSLYKTYSISDNPFIGTFDVIKDADTFTIATSINKYKEEPFKSYNKKPYLKENDALIFNYTILDGITNFNIYGGKLNEGFKTIKKIKENYYLTLIKDQETGGDFGNGGALDKGYLLIKISQNLKEMAYITFKNPIKTIDFEDKIYLFTNSSYFIYDYDLNQELGLKFDFPCTFGKHMFNYMVAILNEDSLKIYDYKLNKVLDNYSYPFTNNIEDVKIVDDKLYLKDSENIYDTIFFNNYLKDKKFVFDRDDLDYLPEELLALPKNLKFKEIKYQENYNQSVFGTYDIALKYDNFEIPSQLEILERSNITNGKIYPVGYHLLFSGIAYLNENQIFNNYEITSPGVYDLRLVGKNKEINKHFIVKEMDINYEEEQLKEWDYEVCKKQNLYLNYVLENVKEKTIKKVIVNNKEAMFKYDNNKNILSVILNEEKEGLYKYHIEKIIYEVGNIEYEEVIDKHIILKVVGDKINLETNIDNTKKFFNFSVNILNNNENLRFILLKTKGKSEKILYIPLKKGKIVLDSELMEKEDADFFLVYDNGKKFLEEEYLFTINYDFKNKNIGEINLNMENDNISNITLKLNNDQNLSKIMIKDDCIYEYHKASSILPVIITIAIVCTFFITYKVIKVIKKHKKK